MNPEDRRDVSTHLQPDPAPDHESLIEEAEHRGETINAVVIDAARARRQMEMGGELAEPLGGFEQSWLDADLRPPPSRPQTASPVPQETVCTLKVRAARAGQSLQAYVRQLLDREAAMLSPDEAADHARSIAARSSATVDDVLDVIDDARQHRQ